MQPGEPREPAAGNHLVNADSLVLVRYDVRQDENGWTIYDRQTDRPGSVQGHDTVGLSREDADEIADLLNTLAFLERRRVVH
jgi:hypothetical protein